jgi:RNA polymerase I-specific transcription initiation factor RRN7
MYKLPYLEAVGLLPESMVLHLTKHNKQALSPNVSLDWVLVMLC